MDYYTYQNIIIGIIVFLVLLLIFLMVVYCKKKKEDERDAEKSGETEDDSWHMDPFAGPVHEEKKAEGKTEEKESSGVKVKFGRGYGEGSGSNDNKRKESGAVKETEELYRLEKEEDRIPCPGCGVENPTENRNCMLCGRILPRPSKSK